MKKPFTSMILSILSILIVGWCLTSLYNAQVQFSNVLKNPEPPWEISFSILPFVSLIIFGIILLIIYVRQKKHKDKHSSWLFPFEFSEQDERERHISGEACRKAFISTWITAPLAATLLVFYPLFQDKFIYFPIILILLIPIIQVIIYYLHIRKI